MHPPPLLRQLRRTHGPGTRVPGGTERATRIDPGRRAGSAAPVNAERPTGSGRLERAGRERGEPAPGREGERGTEGESRHGTKAGEATAGPGRAGAAVAGGGGAERSTVSRPSRAAERARRRSRRRRC